MTANQKRSLCERVGGRVVSTEDQLDTELNSDEPLYSGSRWTKILKST